MPQPVSIRVSRKGRRVRLRFVYPDKSETALLIKADTARALADHLVEYSKLASLAAQMV